jgi:hypothetical protein
MASLAVKPDDSFCQNLHPFTIDGITHDAEDSVCRSSYNDDIGTEEKFSHAAGVQIQNVLICFEMFLATLLHKRVFSYRDYRSLSTRNALRELRKVMGLPTEMVRDVRNLATGAGRLATGNDEYEFGDLAR